MNDETSKDRLLRFLLAGSGVRGAVVSLDDSWREMLQRELYPTPLADLLGQCAAAACLFAGHVKVEGRLSIQVKGEHSIRTLFAECTRDGTVRGLALWQPPLPDAEGLGLLGEDALLAITVEQQLSRLGEPQRYQGLVAIEGAGLAQAFEGYFLRSEQLPTRLLLAANAERARGLLLQVLPGTVDDADAWPRAQALFDTLGSKELLETNLETLLYRLFHEDSPQILSSQDLAFGCSCSRERVGAVLLALGEQESRAALDDTDGSLSVQCEFCGQRYRFDAVDLGQLFSGGGSERPPTTTH